jgi:type IV secretion system protein VirD4
MTLRGVLLGTTAVGGAAAAWTVVASSAMLVVSGLWHDPYFAEGASWTWAWWSYALRPAMRGADAYNLAWSAAVASLLAAAVLVRCGLAWRRKGNKLHGEAHWATEAEARRSGLAYTRTPPGDAFVLGRAKGFLGLGRRYVSLPGQEHVSLYARTRSGKGVSIVVPNCLTWGGSLIAFSIKRDLVKAAAAERLWKGQAVFVFDPTNPDARSHRWNPLGNVPRGRVGCYDAVQRVMQFVVPETKATNPYWENAARRIATAAAVLLAETPGAPLHLAAVRRLIGRADHETNFRAMINAARERGAPYPIAAVDAILGWLDRKTDIGAAGVRDTILTALRLWDSEVIAAATEASDFDLAEIRQRPISVFVCAEVADIRRLRPLFGLFFQQLIDFNTRQEFAEDTRNKHRLACVLDEFWAPGRMDVLADAAAFTASFGFRMLYVVQSKQQLHTIYGEQGAENIFLNTGAELLFGGADQRLAEEVSKRGGSDTVQAVSTARPRFLGWLFPARQHEHASERARSLLLPQEVQRLPSDAMIVLRPTLPPLKLARIVWFRDRPFRTMSGTPPVVPLLHLQVERDPAPAAPPAPTAEESAATAQAAVAAQAETLRARLRTAATEVATTAAADRRAAEDARQAVTRAAIAAEQARHARAEATEAQRAARTAAAGPDPAAADAARLRADVATGEAERLSGAAADAAEIARVAKAAAIAARRAVSAAEKRAQAIARTVEDAEKCVQAGQA